MFEIDPLSYQSKVVFENGVPALYLEMVKVIYGMLVVALLWYRRIRKDLEGIGFKFNPYDKCVANRFEGPKQQTLRSHVNNMLVSCRSTKINDEFAEWCERTCGK